MYNIFNTIADTFCSSIKFALVYCEEVFYSILKQIINHHVLAKNMADLSHLIFTVFFFFFFSCIKVLYTL
jgi:hypothetical protein